jgi:hypothetical protein
MTDPILGYSAALLKDNLGLPEAEVDGFSVPMRLADAIYLAMGGSPEASSEVPSLQHEIARFCSAMVGDALAQRGHFALKSRWPNGAPYAACLTHDIDNIARPLSHILKVRSRFSSTDLALAILGARSLYNNVGPVSELERGRGVKSSYYVLTSNYDLKSMSEELLRLKRDGWDVGLHGEFGTHDSPEKMRDDVGRFEKALGFSPTGVREHFLRFDFKDTWRVVADAGFAYDTTVGNRDALGFRVGLCTPFHPPSADWAPMKLLELPLVLMDVTLWGYLKLSEEEGLKKTRDLISLVSSTGGLFTLLWHPEAIRMKGGRIYPRILDDLVAGGAWVANASDIASWWNARAVPLQRRGDTYLLSGDVPAGLCLEVFARQGLSPAVKGGAVERAGDRFLVRVQSNDFAMEMR